jgi:hypothetical protein
MGWLRDLLGITNSTEASGSDALGPISSELHASSNAGPENKALAFEANFKTVDGEGNFKFDWSSGKGPLPADFVTFDASLEHGVLNAHFALNSNNEPGFVPIEANSITAEHHPSPSADPEQPSQLLPADSHPEYGSWELGMVNVPAGFDL